MQLWPVCSLHAPSIWPALKLPPRLAEHSMPQWPSSSVAERRTVDAEHREHVDLTFSSLSPAPCARVHSSCHYPGVDLPPWLPRSDPTATTDFHGLDAAPVVLAPGAAGERVAVAFVAAGSGGAAGAASSSQHAANGAANGGGGGGGARAQDEGGREARRRRSAEADGRERRRAGSPGRGRGEGEEEGRGRRQGGRDAERGADRDRRRGRDEDGDRAALRDREEREDRRGRRHSRSRSAQRGGGARDRDGDRHRERRNRHEDAEPDGRPVKRRREASPAGGMREEDEGALGGASADTPEQAPAPGVVLEVRREGKLVGNLELGLREAKDKARGPVSSPSPARPASASLHML